MLVAAGIAPMANFAREVGGDLVEVELMVAPGASPHIYQPQPDQMKMLSKASVLVLNGVKLEFWADKVVEAADNPKLIVVKTAEGLPIIESAHDQVHPGGNPHVWLDPTNAMRQVKAIRDAFAKADPAHARTYETNAERFIAELTELDADIRAQVKTFRSRSFISFHPAWVYFARRYGLREAAVIEKNPGREPSPSEIREVVDAARRIRARAIFAEPQFNPKAAEVIADETGAKVLLLDPLGKPPDYDYIKTMRANLAQMAEALR
jgi:zinc transport system substrate-binding protein